MNSEGGFNLELAHTYFAKVANSRTWELLASTNRTLDEDFEMISSAHTSYYHWSQVGTALQQQRGEWLIAHVYTMLGDGEVVLRHAIRCRDLTQTNLELMHDFDIAYGYEGMARAL